MAVSQDFHTRCFIKHYTLWHRNVQKSSQDCHVTLLRVARSRAEALVFWQTNTCSYLTVNSILLYWAATIMRSLPTHRVIRSHLRRLLTLHNRFSWRYGGILPIACLGRGRLDRYITLWRGNHFPGGRRNRVTSRGGWRRWGWWMFLGEW